MDQALVRDTMADMIKPKEIRNYFNIKKDFTLEEEEEVHVGVKAMKLLISVVADEVLLVANG